MSASPDRLVYMPAPEETPYGVALFQAPTPEQARALLGPSDLEERRRRSAVFYRPKLYRARARLPIGQHDRMEEYLLADGEICMADKAGHDRHFPIHIKSVRLHALRLRSGDVADLTASAANDWPWLHQNEELYLRVRIDRLLVEPATRLRWSGNVASIRIGALVATAPIDLASPFAIEIRGTPQYAYSGLRRGSARSGAAGAHGRDGRDGQESPLTVTPFGPKPTGSGPSAGGHGEPGEAGQPGGNGSRGRSGGMVMAAGIELLSVEGFGAAGLRLDVMAGPGEPGGDGGDGGSGGAGGHGAPGRPSLTGAEGAAGDGGQGGDGGPGGDGGRGGPGGIASHVFVTLPTDCCALLEVRARPSPGGEPGKAGVGGSGGGGGKGGPATGLPFMPRPTDGAAGRGGGNGPPGRAGIAGRDGEIPPVWVHAGSSA